MPIEISLPFDGNKVEKAIQYWLDLLANDDYIEAFNLTEHDSYYAWTPELLESYIKGYGLPYKEGEIVYKITDWRTVRTDRSRRSIDIELFDNPISFNNLDFKYIGYVDYDVPLNGERSDLTAVFKILQANNYITLELNDIHVF